MYTGYQKISQPFILNSDMQTFENTGYEKCADLCDETCGCMAFQILSASYNSCTLLSSGKNQRGNKACSTQMDVFIRKNQVPLGYKYMHNNCIWYSNIKASEGLSVEACAEW